MVNCRQVINAAVFILLAYIIADALRYYNHREDPSEDDAAIFNAYANLSLEGFTSAAESLLMLPEHFRTTPLTVFAIPDSVMRKRKRSIKITPEFLFYHVSSYKLTFQDLFDRPVNTCLPSVLEQERIAITKRDDKKRLLEINNVKITRPDFFVQGQLVVHGVAGPLASFDRRNQLLASQLPDCEWLESKFHNTSTSSIRLKLVFNMNRPDPWGL